MAKGNHSNKVTAYWMDRCYQAEVAEIEAVRERDQLRQQLKDSEESNSEWEGACNDWKYIANKALEHQKLAEAETNRMAEKWREVSDELADTIKCYDELEQLAADKMAELAKVKPVAKDMAERIRVFEDAYQELNSNDDTSRHDVLLNVIVQTHRELRDSLERYDAIQQLETEGNDELPLL